MSINSYLVSLASSLVLKEAEKDSINRSITTIHQRLNYYFGNNIEEDFRFGSHTRDTILPRSADSNSDIDYMVVFNNQCGYKPQTYLNKLRSFTERYYSRSEIKQSHPTIVLELNHIKFELVPAYHQRTLWFDEGYKIPAPSNNYEEWMSTNPNDFNQQLTNVNTANCFKVKSLIRLLKYWNARNGYVYSSYLLEQYIISTTFLWCNSLKDYFKVVVDNLPEYGLSGVKVEKVRRLKQNIKEIYGDEEVYPTYALSKLKNILPEL
ncbi:MAG: SMODS domain-containing nucleotidyltransferase [Cellulosilyticaceae bacterium]